MSGVCSLSKEKQMKNHHCAYILVAICSLLIISPVFGQSMKPTHSDGMQFVAAGGSDSNDGLGWGTAKATIAAAVAALPTSKGIPYGTIHVGAGVYTVSSPITVPSQQVRIMGVSEEQTQINCTFTASGACLTFAPTNPNFNDNDGGLYNLTVWLNGRPNQTAVKTIDFADGFTMQHVWLREPPSADGIGSIGWLAINDGASTLTQTERSSLSTVSFAHFDVGIEGRDTASRGTHNSMEHGMWHDVRWNLGNNQTAVELLDDVNLDGTFITGTVNPNGTRGMTIFDEAGTGRGTVSARIFVDGGGSGITGANVASGGNFQVLGGFLSAGGGGKLPTLCSGSGTCIVNQDGGQVYFYSNSGIHLTTQNNAPLLSAGTVKLTNGSAKHVFATAYRTAPVCTAIDTTAGNMVRITNTTRVLSIAGQGADVISWICTPAAN
jgi:hypothetical protein